MRFLERHLHRVAYLAALVAAVVVLAAMYRASEHDADDRTRHYERAMSLARTAHDSMEVELTFERARQRETIDDEDSDHAIAAVAGGAR